MGVMVATLGHEPQRVTGPLASATRIKKLIVFHSESEKSKKANKEARSHARKMGLTYRSHQLPNSFEVETIVDFIKKNIRKEIKKGEVTLFNPSGGTHIMSASAVLVAMLYGIPMVYVREDNHKTVDLPVLKMEYKKLLTPTELKIVDRIRASLNPTSKELAKELGMNKSTFSNHLRRLEEKDAVIVEPDPDDKRKKRIHLSPAVKLMVVD